MQAGSEERPTLRRCAREKQIRAGSQRLHRGAVEFAERSEAGCRFQFFREVADERLHSGVPETIEAEEIHFLDGLGGRPAVVAHAVGRHEDAGAIVAETAMDEDFFVRVAKERKKLRDLVIAGRRPTADGDVDEAQAGGFGLFALPRDFIGVFAAKIDDGGNAERFQLLKASGFWLRTTIERIVNFSKVRESGEF